MSRMAGRLERTAPPVTATLQRQCTACAAQASVPSREEEDVQRLQAKVRFGIGAAGDRHEREADRAAGQVMSGDHAQVSAGSVGGSSALQRQSAMQAGDAAGVAEVIASSGHALDTAVRQRFEPRFGHDFSRVTIHSDARAAASASAVNAHAYTVGNHVVFGAGQYAPGSMAGQHLLAHELAHVIQQGAGGMPNQAGAQAAGALRVQRQAKDAGAAADGSAPAGKLDVSIVLSDDEKDDAEGGAYATTVRRVTSVDDARDKLKALGAPIGTLYVISHSTSSGKLEFVGASGGVSWTPAEELADRLKGVVNIDRVDFRGCKMGDSGNTLETFRDRVGAQSAKGTNCWSFIARMTPLTLGGVPVTRKDQIPADRRRDFDAALLQQVEILKADDGTSVKDCMIGLSPKKRANAANLAEPWKLYWANQGRLVSSWASPKFNRNWQQGESICTRDMTATTTPCAVVEAKAPTP
ncbi:MAG: DUF4157 domain-containing protein [Betaproteobacteria bacterium]|jgi:hypothetical protein|nr:DUF4157 domain-containing protein [Betaproteobacteria bacterium]